MCWMWTGFVTATCLLLWVLLSRHHVLNKGQVVVLCPLDSCSLTSAVKGLLACCPPTLNPSLKRRLAVRRILDKSSEVGSRLMSQTKPE